MGESYIVFPSRTDGYALEKRLKNAGIGYEMVPTPREFIQSCSISIKLSDADLDEVRNIIAYSPNIKTRGIHKLKKKKAFRLFG